MKPKLQMIKVEDGIIKCGDLFTHEQYIPRLTWPYIAGRLGYSKYALNRTKAERKDLTKGGIRGTKEINRELTQKLGVSPKKFAHMLRGAQYNLWIKGKEEYISKLCVCMGRWSPNKISILNKHWDVIKQYEDDGLYNLLPLAFYTGKLPHELKRLLGKSVWKKYCSNTFYRNKLIAQYIGVLEDVPLVGIFCDTPYEKRLKEYYDDYFYYYKKQIDIPSSIFRYQKSYDVAFCKNLSIIWGVRILKENKMLTKKGELLRLHDIYMDTERMAKRLNKPFNSSWSLKRMQETHDKYTKEINALKYSDEFISCLKDIPVKEYSRYGLTAKLLTSPLQIRTQGVKEHHCVGSYTESVKRGGYLVYSINDKDGNIVSTLGINIRYTGEYTNIAGDTSTWLTERSPSIDSFKVYKMEERSFHFSQHYMKYDKSINNYIDNTVVGFNPLEEMQKEILDKLNKEMYDVDKLLKETL